MLNSGFNDIHVDEVNTWILKWSSDVKKMTLKWIYPLYLERCIFGFFPYISKTIRDIKNILYKSFIVKTSLFNQ